MLKGRNQPAVVDAAAAAMDAFLLDAPDAPETKVSTISVSGNS